MINTVWTEKMAFIFRRIQMNNCSTTFMGCLKQISATGHKKKNGTCETAAKLQDS